MNSWMIYAAIVVFGAAGIHIFSKLSMASVEPLFLSVVVSGTFFLMALVIFSFNYQHSVPELTVLSAREWLFIGLAGLCMACANIAVIFMYKYNAPLSVAVPVTRLGAAGLAVLVGLIIFKEALSLTKLSGIALAVVSIVLMTM